MPLVFVHGVATRQTADYKARVQQRDALFRKMVLPKGSEIFDPDWGSNAVKFDPKLPWLPVPGAAEAWSAGDGIGGESGIGRVARKKPEIAIDLAFQSGLSERIRTATESGQPADAVSEDDLAAFEAAVRYLENPGQIDKDVFDPDGSDADFLSALADELKAHAPAKAGGAEPMSLVGDGLSWIGRGLKKLVDPVANVTSDAVLRLIRRPLSEQVALFLGDIFVYLRWRETHGAAGTVQRIFEPIIGDLAKAAKLRSKTDPLILVCHSLGAVILYDLLTDKNALSEIAQQAGADLVVDAWVTVGAQPAVFADMGLYAAKPLPSGLLARPAPVRNWLNVYDYTDVLSFSCKPKFADVEDYEFDNVSSLLSAHSAYFQRPGFYSRLRSRLKDG